MKQVLSIVLVLGAVAALAGPAHAAAGQPAWCNTPGLNARDQPGSFEYWKKPDDTIDWFYDIIGMSCSDDHSNVEHAADIAKNRAELTKVLDLTDADWADAAVWASQETIMRTSPSFYAPEKKAWSKYDGIDQYYWLRASHSTYDDLDYFADALDGKLTAIGRMGYLENCVPKAYMDSDVAARWALCAPDIALFDPNKVKAELHADTTHTGYERTVIRVQLFRMRQALAEQAKAVKDLIAKDEAYGVLFELAASARKDWDAKVVARQPVLDLLLAMDDGVATGSRKAFTGCDDTTWAAWQKAIGALPAKRFEHMRGDPDRLISFSQQALGVVMSDPDSYLAAAALATCHANSDMGDYLDNELGDPLQYSPGYRGPRSQAHTAMLSAGIVLDDKDARLAFPGVNRQRFISHHSGEGSGRGPIASAKVDGKKLHLVFKKKKEKQEDCAKSHRTNRVTYIRNDGGLVYEEICDKTVMVDIEVGDDPADVDARYATAIKPGVTAWANGGIVEVVWTSPAASTPIAVFGVAVK
ncbi:MAG TPA: hypothetical protein VL463_16590 [Kofleriaceae bacterium]|jgi:hypothetical protein|nr:hypothetical protein [Kofleriaceae bacterium]